MKNLLVIISFVSLVLLSGCTNPLSGGYSLNQKLANCSLQPEVGCWPSTLSQPYYEDGILRCGPEYSVIYERAECYRDLAVSQNDTTFCERVIEGQYVNFSKAVELKQNCYDVVEHGYPVHTNLCDNPDNKNLLVCVTTPLNLSFCGNIGEDSTNNRADCYEKLAVQEDNVLICDSMRSDSYFSNNSVMMCYSNYATENKDVQICGLIQDDFYKLACITDVAVASNDSSICDLQTNASKVSLCKDIVQGYN